MDVGPAEDAEIEDAVSFYTDGCSETVASAPDGQPDEAAALRQAL